MDAPVPSSSLVLPADGGADPAAPVTVMVTRAVAPADRDRFEAVIGAVTRAAMAFPGHLGATIMRPGGPGEHGPGEHGPGERDYRILFKFDSRANLDAWFHDPATRTGLGEADALTVGAARMEVLHGLEAWFTVPASPPSSSPPPPPPRWKMAALTWLALFPLVSALLALLGPVLARVPFLAGTLVVTGLVTGLMTWVVMPRLTRLAGPWLRKG